MRSLNVSWRNLMWFAILHGGAVAAWFWISWPALWCLVALHAITGGLGICIGYHRYLTHASFTTYRPVRCLLALCGNLAGEGPATHWVAFHRQHHQHSDTAEDPHSPAPSLANDGAGPTAKPMSIWSRFWHSHVGWMLRHDPPDVRSARAAKYAPDLLHDRAVQLIDCGHFIWHLLLAAALFGLGSLWSFEVALSCLLWGMCLRIVSVLHSTWLVNSAGHLWGYITYRTTGDQSRNNPVVALLSYGEGWHNNHHAYPTAANHGQRWCEFDPAYRLIWFFSRLGLAWNVKYHAPAGTS